VFIGQLKVFMKVMLSFKKSCLLMLFIIACVAQNASAQALVWKVSKGQDYFYLGGTIHVLTEKDHPLPVEYQQAYLDADTLIFEASLAEISSPQFQSTMLQAMTYQDGRSLKNELSPSVYQQLSQFLSSRGVQVNDFLRFKPWGIALTLTVMEYQRLGMTDTFGVDAYFNALAQRDNKKVMALETAQQQLAALMSMASVDANQMISNTLRDMQDASTLIVDLKNTWRHGDVKALGKSPLLLQMQQETPHVYEELLLKRNQHWMKSLPSLFDQAGIEFVLVGAMHLVGEQGLITLLQQQGFTLKQL